MIFVVWHAINKTNLLPNDQREIRLITYVWLANTLTEKFEKKLNVIIEGRKAFVSFIFPDEQCFLCQQLLNFYFCCSDLDTITYFQPYIPPTRVKSVWS